MSHNTVMMQAFEWELPDDGKFYTYLKESAQDLSESGIGSVWLPPMYKAIGSNDVGYGVYDIYDLGEFDQKGSVRTKYGTLDELRTAIEELHNYNIKVYADVVLNHKAGADYTEVFQAIQVDENDRTKEISEPHDIEAWTGFNFPGREGKHSDFEWNFNHFTGIDYDVKNEVDGVFKIVGENKQWSKGVSKEKGNYDYLMFADIDHKHSDVRTELFNWGEWFINYVDIDGMRFDALKHIEGDFIKEFIMHIEEVSEKDLYFFGEYWIADTEVKNKYLYETKYHTDLFDVALHYKMESASKNSADFDMRKIFDNTLVQEHPTIAVTFVDNHDSQPGQSLESFVKPWFKPIAYSLILLRHDGYPCVFYGDYYGIGGDNPQESQRDMIDNLIDIRLRYGWGKQTDYMAAKDLIGWVRHGVEDHPSKLAVVISTGDMNTLEMNMGAEQAGKTYFDLTGNNDNELTIDEEGNGQFEVGPGSVSCWVEKL